MLDPFEAATSAMRRRRRRRRRKSRRTRKGVFGGGIQVRGCRLRGEGGGVRVVGCRLWGAAVEFRAWKGSVKGFSAAVGVAPNVSALKLVVR